MSNIIKVYMEWNELYGTVYMIVYNLTFINIMHFVIHVCDIKNISLLPGLKLDTWYSGL